ncbi:MAG: winged helix-turn-helix domain-containing protein, partial [Pyrinomonadaceae bacterium]
MSDFMQQPEARYFYEFGTFRLDASEKTLLRDGEVVPLAPKVFDMLEVFVRNAGRLIEKDELMRLIWQDRFVEEGNLAFNVKVLRRALGDSASEPRFIETVLRRGYRFIAEVRKIADGELREKETIEIPASDGGDIIRRENAANSINEIGGSAIPENAPADNSLSAETRADKISQSVVSAIGSRPFFYSFGAITLGIFLLTGFFLLKHSKTFSQRFDEMGERRFLTVEKLTDTGDAFSAKVSPDGKLLAYYTTEGNQNTIWLRRLATGKSASLYSSADESFYSVGFTPDGEYVSFSHSKKGAEEQLSRISILGGTPTLVVDNFHGSTGFSPDGKQIAFVRFGESGSVLTIAEADGGQNERKIFTSPNPRFIIAIAWSPDGKQIAYCVGNGRYDGGSKDSSPFVYNLETETNAPLTDFKWNYLRNIYWLPDASGILITAREKAEDTDQIWRVSLPDGRAERITDDSNSLIFGGASADFSHIVAMQSYINSTVYIAPSDEAANARPIAKAEFDVDWTTDGKIVFPARETTKTDIWQMNADGGDKRQMTVNDSLERYATASPDGRFIVYVSNRNGRQNLWRMDAADGGNQMPLTNGDGESSPTVTPDGRFVVFNRTEDGSLWQVPIEGGGATRLSEEKTQRVAFSPDGTKIAYFGRKDDKRKLLVKSFPEAALLGEFDASMMLAAARVGWARREKGF